MARTSITIDSEYLKKINYLGEKFKMNNKVLIQTMVDYFEYYQINPNDREVDLDSKFSSFEKKLDKLRDLFVSFIREMEKRKLDPIIKQTNELTQALLVYLKEEAPTKDDLKTFGSTKRVAFSDKKIEEKQLTDVSLNDENEDSKELKAFIDKATLSISLYKTYFNELIKSISRTDNKGDYLLVSAINEFREKVKSIPKVTFDGKITKDNEDRIEGINSRLRVIDNYCDEFLANGTMAAGKDKLFYHHTISEYKLKFENVRII